MEGSYNGQKILVVGAARSGVAAAEFLLAQGAHVVLTDTKSEDMLAASLARLRASARKAGELTLELGGHRAESFRDSDLVVVSPGVPLAHPLFEESRKAGVPIIAEIELAWRHLRGRILGITGSNGKTTTTALVAELLRTAGMRGFAAGNIGTPLIAYASTSDPLDVYAVELSSFQLEGIRNFRPHVGAVLNLTPDHMDRYRTFEDYISAKLRVFMNQSAEDFAVLNADDPRTADLASRVPSAPVWFSRRSQVSRGTFVEKERIIYRGGSGDTELLSAGDIRLRGSHNFENVLAACTIAMLAEASPASLAKGVRGFTGVEHRLEFVAELNGVQYFNDSKATNVDSTVKSLEAFGGNVVLIAGGRDKGSDFLPLRAPVSQRVKHLILIGEAAGKMRLALSDSVTTSSAASLPEAVERAWGISRPGDIVLLAPACASFDMFENYEHRGRVFKEAVRGLARK